MSKDLRNPNRRFGSSFYLVLGLLASGREFKNLAELAKEVNVTRQRVRVIIAEAVEAGFLDESPFPAQPQMSRAKKE